ncbi:hypothetical protein PV325_006553 [Microctonus aethiopoides]|nr:hypothetical protein PV325_006553 [Microctonus aethiopoides]
MMLMGHIAAIQNTPTSSKMSDNNVILSASSLAHDKTILSSFSLSKTKDSNIKELTSDFEITQPALQLESSRSMNSLDGDDADSIYKLTTHDGVLLDATITASKHVEHIDGNNIEVKPVEYYESIASTKDLSGEGQGAPQVQHILSEPHHMVGSLQQRQGRQDLPKIYSDRALSSNMQTVAAGNQRQANPDIQDIITGIVKLLNGNVNVAANTIRPHKPTQTTRINNRGPPRISDLPPLPLDFDTPGMNPPLPPADEIYPFEKPPAPERPSVNQLPPVQERPTPVRPFINGILVPESVVPQGNRPWNRPQHRPNTIRRPIPPYKPLPPQDNSYNHDIINDKEIKVPDTSANYSEEDDDNKKNHSQMSSQHSDTIDEMNTRKSQKYKPPLNQNKVVADNTLILGSDLQPIPIPNNHDNSPVVALKNDNINKSNSQIQGSYMEIKSDTNNKINTQSSSIFSSTSLIHRNVTRTTLKIETSSSIQVIEPTRTIIEIQPSIVPLESIVETTSTISTSLTASETQTTMLESSRIAEETTSSNNGNYHISTPTDGLTTKSSSATSNIIIENPTSSSSSSSSTTTTTTTKTYRPTSMMTFYKTSANANYPYRPRPGIVLDDTLDYTGAQLATQRPYAPSRHPQIGDIFDVTVSAIQGPGGGNGDSVRVSLNPGVTAGGSDIIFTSAVEGHGFVSIDGKRTYLNLFDNTNEGVGGASKIQIESTRIHPPPIIGTGYAVPQTETISATSPRPIIPSRRPTFHRRPTQPPVRIDTCIVGDLSTCDTSQHEACATIQGVSACHCKPGYARLIHTLPCKRVISILVSIRVDRIYDWKIVWNHDFNDKESESYQTIAFESNRAIESAMSMTPFSDEYMGSSINSVYQGDISKGQGGVFVNATLKLTYESRTSRPSVASELQRHLVGVIHRRNNNIGNSAVYVDTPVGSISSLQDLDECASSELNDCNSSAVCINNWGGFTCTCNAGLKDPHKDEINESGRSCISCPSSHCNNRGTCSYQGNIMQCSCTGNNYGAQCEIDGEVLGVAIGASVAALIIIILTLICLVMWSRRWSREQKTAGSPVYGYMQGGIPGTLPGTLVRVGSVGTLASVKQGMPSNLPPYLWGHIADRMAQANLYATEPMGPTRPSSAVFGYPTMSCHGTLPPVPLPRLQAPSRPSRQRHQQEPDSSDSEPQDKDRADLIPQSSGFHVPRPKSRSSLANQSGIYYDVEYDQGDAQHLSKNNIPMSTYSMARPYYRT